VSEPLIQARKVQKFFAQPDGSRIEVIAATDLDIHPGTIVALLGPSGSGKSTLLRMLTGLAQPSAGEVLWHGRPLAEQSPNVSIVFQSFALFPWLTVMENVEAPLEARGVALLERHKRALRALDVVGLDGFESAYPKELSGGMRQRVGFARAMVVEPEVLFMDEPFSALDVLTAETLRRELVQLWQSKKMTTSTIFIVTHNIEEAVQLADRIIVLGRNPGHIRSDFEVGLPHPRDRKVPRFLELVDFIYTVMTQPQAECVPPAADAAGAPVVVKQKHVALPHARPGGIAGLMEMLHDRGGRDELYRLADELAMDVDDLLPILDAALLLGFVILKDGDAEITPEGKEFATADIQTRKAIFRTAAMRNVSLLRQIDYILHTKSDHAIPQEFFQDILDEHFSEKESERQMQTLLHWGRYAEIFDYDSAHERLFLTEAALHTNHTTTGKNGA